ncbi:hypothetical protein [Streptomyces sp. Da 82-17]|uniref:hypothetical protein n=1 Tax=Streptomyces sp. Da 82-17 TaxID=3377116 RepID=UPI0038D36FC6
MERGEERVFELIEKARQACAVRDFGTAYRHAEEALQAVPMDGSLGPEKFEQLQHLAWIVREDCRDLWSYQPDYPDGSRRRALAKRQARDRAGAASSEEPNAPAL